MRENRRGSRSFLKIIMDWVVSSSPPWACDSVNSKSKERRQELKFLGVEKRREKNLRIIVMPGQDFNSENSVHSPQFPSKRGDKFRLHLRVIWLINILGVFIKFWTCAKIWQVGSVHLLWIPKTAPFRGPSSWQGSHQLHFQEAFQRLSTPGMNFQAGCFSSWKILEVYPSQVKELAWLEMENSLPRGPSCTMGDRWPSSTLCHQVLCSHQEQTSWRYTHQIPHSTRLLIFPSDLRLDVLVLGKHHSEASLIDVSYKS